MSPDASTRMATSGMHRTLSSAGAQVEEWLRERVEFELDGGNITATLDCCDGEISGSAVYEVFAADDNISSGYIGDNWANGPISRWPGPGCWPDPPASLIAEARLTESDKPSPEGEGSYNGL